MRIATWNILSGRSPGEEAVDEGRFADAVRSLGADLLGLQEVDRAQPRSGNLDLTAVAAEAMGAREWMFAPALTGTPDSWRGATGREAAGRADVRRRVPQPLPASRPGTSSRCHPRPCPCPTDGRAT